MNGKKARHLRNLMSVESNRDVTQYEGIGHTAREIHHKVPVTNSDGTTTQKILATVKTMTFKNKYRPRAMYKMMKKFYMSKVMAYPPST